MTIPQIYEFVRTQKHAVVATIDDEGKPRSSVTDFCEEEDLTIILNTHTDSLQYRRLTDSPHVAIVIGGDKGIVVQISAIASELSGQELADAKDTLCLKNDEAKNSREDAGIAYFACKPTWVRYSDLNQNPWFIEEFDVEPDASTK